jgi:hypothetical protein
VSFESDALKRVNLTRRGLQSAIEGRVAECLEAGAGERRGGGSSSQDRRGGGGVSRSGGGCTSPACVDNVDIRVGQKGGYIYGELSEFTVVIDSVYSAQEFEGYTSAEGKDARNSREKEGVGGGMEAGGGAGGERRLARNKDL